MSWFVSRRSKTRRQFAADLAPSLAHFCSSLRYECNRNPRHTPAGFLLSMRTVHTWVAILLVFCGGPLQAQPYADLVVKNADVTTMDPTRPTAQGFAIAGTTIALVGTNRELAGYVGPDTRIEDLGGKVVLPGLIDAHLHALPSYPEGHRLHRVDLGGATTPDMASLVKRLKKQADARPEGDWVIGLGYEDTVLGRHPDRVVLDGVSAEHPVYITHSSGHRAVANSLALKLGGISEDVRDPPGGAYLRDTHGQLNGQLLELAAAPVREAHHSTPSVEELMTGVETTLRQFAANGLTTVVDATPFSDAWLYPVFTALKKAGRLPVRVVVMVPYDMLEELDAGSLEQDEWVSVGPVKLFHGNSLSGRTAWLSQPYVGRPDDYGIPPARSQAELDAVVRAIDRHGMQAAIHSNGDREIDMVLRAFENLRSDSSSRRHRIEHGSVMTAELLERTRKAGLVLALHSYVYEHGDKMEGYGAARWEWMHVNRSALELGIVVAGNSDFPVSAAVPMLRFQSLLTRRARNGRVYGGSQRIDFEGALETFTQGAAYSIFQEDRVGSIAPGKLADFIVLDRDPRLVAADRLSQVKVLSTWVGGRQM